MREDRLVAILAGTAAAATLILVVCWCFRSRSGPEIEVERGHRESLAAQTDPAPRRRQLPPRPWIPPAQSPTELQSTRDRTGAAASFVPSAGMAGARPGGPIDLPVRITGLVLDHRGEPLADARVRVVMHSRDRGHRVIPRPAVTSSGRFSFSVHARLGDAFFGDVQTTHEDYLEPAVGRVTVIPDSVADAGVLQFRVVGGRFVGRVTGPTGAAMTGIPLEFVPLQAAPNTPGPRLCVTGEDGGFRSPMLDLGTYEVRATPLLEGANRRVTLREHGSIVALGDLVLAGVSFSTRGFVLDRNGKPPKKGMLGVALDDVEIGEGMKFLETFPIAADGRFQFELNHPGPYKLVLSMTGDMKKPEASISELWLVDQQLRLASDGGHQVYDPCKHCVD